MTTTQAADQRPTTRPVQTTRVTDPHRLHDAFMAGVNAHDPDDLLALYDTDGLAVELDGSQARGADAMRAMITGLTTAIRHIEGTTRKIFVVGDVCLSSASWTADVVLPDGTTLTQSGVTAEVSVRQPDGSWRFLIDDPMFV